MSDFTGTVTVSGSAVILYDDRGAHDRGKYLTFDFTAGTTRVVCDHLCSHHNVTEGQ